MSNLKIISENWSAQAALMLEPACNDTYTINDLAFDVQSGDMSLFNVYEAGELAASMALRLEQHQSGKKELVVVALGGRSGGDLIQKCITFWDELAAKNEAISIRAHVAKKGMARLMERAGGVLSEYVYKRKVAA